METKMSHSVNKFLLTLLGVARIMNIISIV